MGIKALLKITELSLVDLIAVCVERHIEAVVKLMHTSASPDIVAMIVPSQPRRRFDVVGIYVCDVVGISINTTEYGEAAFVMIVLRVDNVASGVGYRSQSKRVCALPGQRGCTIDIPSLRPWKSECNPSA